MLPKSQHSVDCSGKRLVSEYIESIRSEVQEYFGELTELKAGARSKPPEKPECLIQHEMIKRLGIPLIAGGFLDQPYMWVLEDQAVSEVVDLFDVLNRLANLSLHQLLRKMICPPVYGCMISKLLIV